jgi:MFS family permease
VVVAWFRRHRGLALGIALAGIGAGAALVPLLVQAVISSYGWRFGYIVFGLLVLIVSLPLTYLFLRETPEEMGLNVDGDEIGEKEKVELSHTGSVNQPGLTMTEVARTRSFWLMLFSFFLSGIIMTGMFVHMVPMLIDRGLTPALAAYASAALGISLIVGRIFSGYLMDRFFAPYVAALFLAAMTLGVMIFASGTAGPFVFVGAAMVGLAMGSEMSEIAYIISRYFGLRAFGKIYGFIFSGFQLGGAIGAPVLGIYHDKMGDYVGILWVLVGVGVVSTILIAMLGKYPSATRPTYALQTPAAAC